MLVATYVIYLALTVAFTIWVGLTLSRNGVVFLRDVFTGDGIAEAVNQLLVVGFYLVNFGFVVLFLRTRDDVSEPRQVFELLSTKIGTVLLVLGLMHLLNVWVFTKLRRNRLEPKAPQQVFVQYPVAHER